jgi:hypothetical protein
MWRCLFFVQRKNGKDDTYAIGSFIISVWSDVEYFDFNILKSVQDWRKKWLYVLEEKSAGQKFGLAEYSADIVVRKKMLRRHGLSATKTANTDKLMAQVLAFQ